MCGSKTGRFFHANSNVLSIRSFYLLLAIFPGRNWSFRVKTKKERQDPTFLNLPTARYPPL
jgi:hypothetical protein